MLTILTMITQHDVSDTGSTRESPHSIEAEEYLLSCCLLDGSDTIARCIEEKLSPGSFYVPANRVVFARLCEMYNSGLQIDLAVLVEELKASHELETVGGITYLTQISGDRKSVV